MQQTLDATGPSTAPTSDAASASRIPEFDGLRGLAILLVVIGHFGEFSIRSRALSSACAEAGVLIFFVLSGFLITSLLCVEESRSQKPVDLRRFYIRRALRLLPAAWTLIGVVVSLKILGLVTDETWVGVGASLLYVRNIFGRGSSLAHLWSLSLEEQFYFVWPLLFVLLPRRRLQVAVIVVVAVVAARAIAMAYDLVQLQTGVAYLRPWFRFDSIMSGCVLALLKLRRPAFFAATTGWFARLTHPVAGLCALAVLGYFEWSPRLVPWSLTLQTVACVTILAGVAAGSSPYSNCILRFAPITFLGRVSYSIYLWQQLFVVTKAPNWGWLRRPPFDVLLTLVCALLSWYLIERPLLMFKSRWRA